MAHRPGAARPRDPGKGIRQAAKSFGTNYPFLRERPKPWTGSVVAAETRGYHLRS